MTPIERDLLIRTVLGEAAGEPDEGQRAVAGVVLNRLNSGKFGNNLANVILQPNAFEAWSKPQRLLSYSTSDNSYKRAAEAVDLALSGKDPSKGATFFLNPELQSQLGRRQPRWATGNGQRIGRHVFYGGKTQMAENETNDPFSKAFGLSSSAEKPVTMEPESDDDPFSKAFGVPAQRTDPEASSPKSTRFAAGRVRSARKGTEIDVLSPALSFAGGAVEGLPIVGPALKKGSNVLASGIEALVSDVPYSEASQKVKGIVEEAEQKHPYWKTAGEVGGTVAGYGALVAGAPAAFGLTAPSLPAAMGISGSTNALIGATDAAVRGRDPLTGGAIGGVAGLVAPPIGAGISRMFRPAIEQETARLADLAMNKYKIPLSADMLSANPMVKFARSVVERFPMTGGTAAESSRRSAFTRAVANTMGTSSDRVTPAVMQATRRRIGKVFDNVAANTRSIGADTQFGDDLVRIHREAATNVTEGELKPIETQLRNLVRKFSTGGDITGDQYLALTRHNGPLDIATKSKNPNIAHYAQRIEDALNGALERSATSGNVAALRQARSQWKAMRTIQDLAEKSTDGTISPPLLMEKVRKSYDDMAFGGGGDLAELARIGQAFLKAPPSSGTMERSTAMKWMDTVGQLGLSLGSGAAAGAAIRHPIAAVAGLAAPSVVGRGAGAVLRSPRVVNALTRRALNPPPARGGTTTNAAAQALTQQGKRPVENYLERK